MAILAHFDRTQHGATILAPTHPTCWMGNCISLNPSDSAIQGMYVSFLTRFSFVLCFNISHNIHKLGAKWSHSLCCLTTYKSMVFCTTFLQQMCCVNIKVSKHTIDTIVYNLPLSQRCLFRFPIIVISSLKSQWFQLIWQDQYNLLTISFRCN